MQGLPDFGPQLRQSPLFQPGQFGEAIVFRGQDANAHLVDQAVKGGLFTRQFGCPILRGEGDLDLPLLSGHRADQLLLKSVNEPS